MTTFTESASTALQLITSFDPALLAIVGRSLSVSAMACALACTVGLATGAWLGAVQFAGRDVLLALLNTFLAIPSVVVGLVVYLLLSRSGPLGFLGWLFSVKAMVLAQALLVLPVVTALTRQCVEDAQNRHGEQIQSLGAKPLMRSLLLAWDERYALLTVLIASFGRAISEVGAVMIVGGNIDGFTRVMTTAIALETSKGDLPLALALGLILMGVVLALNGLVAGVKWWRQRMEAGGGTAHPVRTELVEGAVDKLGTSLRQAQAELTGDAIATNHAHLHYNPRSRAALSDITLRITVGERVALIGSNGSGKSSLLRLLHGLMQPSSGTVTLHPERQPTQRQAMLFQRPYMMRSTCINNVALGLWLRGVPWRIASAQALGALERVGLAALAQRGAKTLSGGQQQRLALARAWVLQPDVLLLDEPTASLDPHAKREVEALLAELAVAANPQGSHAITLIFASHNLGQVKRLATRVIYLEQGRVLADLPVADFFEGPLLKARYPAAYFFTKGEFAWPPPPFSHHISS
jgi:tungstate transport system ATP-binding protein